MVCEILLYDLLVYENWSHMAVRLWWGNSRLRHQCHRHGGPSDAGDCNHPPPKMATAENPTSGKAAFDHVAGHGSLQFLAYEQVLGSANLWNSNLWSLRVRMVKRGTGIFRREAGGLIKRGGWLRVQRRVTRTSDSVFASWCWDVMLTAVLWKS